MRTYGHLPDVSNSGGVYVRFEAGCLLVAHGCTCESSSDPSGLATVCHLSKMSSIQGYVAYITRGNQIQKKKMCHGIVVTAAFDS